MAKCVRPISLPRLDMDVPCGSCGHCLQNRKQDWQFRLSDELKYCETSYFVTLTYSDDYVPVKNGQDVLEKSDLQKFFKRLRKRHALHSKTQIRYFAVGEYGTLYKRPHYHIILFNARANDVEDSWPAGYVQFEPVNMGRVGYVVGYVSSIDNDSVSRGVPRQFAVMSRRPAIGYRYLQTHGHWHSNGLRNYTQVSGIMGRLPRYYKLKIFDKNQQVRLRETALTKWEKTYDTWYEYFKSTGHSDPALAIREMEYRNEQKIYSNILNNKLKL